MTPVALMVTVFNALHGVNEFGEEITYRLAGSIGVKGFPEVTMKNMFAPVENGQPAAMQAALSLGERFGRNYYQSAVDSFQFFLTSILPAAIARMRCCAPRNCNENSWEMRRRRRGLTKIF